MEDDRQVVRQAMAVRVMPCRAWRQPCCSSRTAMSWLLAALSKIIVIRLIACLPHRRK